MGKELADNVTIKSIGLKPKQTMQIATKKFDDYKHFSIVNEGDNYYIQFRGMNGYLK